MENLKSEINSFNSNLPVEEASMPPASWYTDPKFLALEKEVIFSKTWQPIVRISEFSKNNSYLSGVMAGIPWVLTRDGDGKLRAFYNVCPHKGREVVTGSSDSSNGELVCGYHAWRFNLEGGLKSAPQIGGIKNFCKKSMSLLPMSVTEWGHWIFINGDPNASPIEEHFGELTGIFESRNWDDLEFHSAKYWTINCNWKVFADNYLDGGYHIPFMHPSLDAQLDMSSYQTVLYDRFSIQTSAPTNSESSELGYDPKERIGEGSVYAWTYPNFMINLYGPCLDTNYVLPINENQCRVYYEFFFKKSGGTKAKEFIEESIKQADITQEEDIEICESVQLGLSSGAYRPGRYAPRLEAGEYHFHQLLSKDFKTKL